MFCITCGHKIEVEIAKFCSKCGTKVGVINEELKVEVKEDTPATVKLCINCGKNPVSNGDGLCKNCAYSNEMPTWKFPNFITSIKNKLSALKGAISKTGVFEKASAFLKKHKKIAVCSTTAVFVLLFTVITITVRPYNPQYEVIPFGRYDAIFYIGEDRYFVMRGTGDNIRWGVQDIRGNEIIEFGRFERPYDGFFNLRGTSELRLSNFNPVPIFENIVTHNGNFAVQRGLTVYIKDPRGRVLTSFENNGDFERISYVNENRFIVRERRAYYFTGGVIDARGREIIPLGLFGDIEASNDGNWFRVWDGFNARHLIMNSNGNEIISSNASLAPNNRFIAWRDGGVSVYDSRGGVIIPHGRFNNIHGVGESYFAVRDGRSWGLVNASGNFVIHPRYGFISYAGGNSFLVEDERRYAILDNRGREIIPFGRYDFIWPGGNGRLHVSSGGNNREIATNIGIMHFALEDSRVGIVDTRGNEVIQFGRYDDVIPVPGDRFIARLGGIHDSRRPAFVDHFWIDARWAVLDTSGNEIIPFGRYDSIRIFSPYKILNSGNFFSGVRIASFSNDYGFIVQNGDRVGVRCVNGHEIIPLGRYDNIIGKNNGLAIVERGGRVALINTRRING